MADDIPDDVKDGDALTPAMLNAVFGELRRWRKLSGTGGVTVQGADSSQPPRIDSDPVAVLFVMLTGAAAGAAYPWKEVCFTAGRVPVDTGLTGSAAADPAYECQTGDTTLTAGTTVYEARRSACSGELLFDGKN